MSTVLSAILAVQGATQSGAPIHGPLTPAIENFRKAQVGGRFEGPEGRVKALNLVSGFTSASAGISRIGEGIAKSRALKGGARDLEFQAKREILIGQQNTIDVLRAGNEALAANQVAIAASGVTREGSIATGEASLKRDIKDVTDLSILDANVRALTRREAARQLRRQAKAARISGFISAASELGSFAASTLGRRI